MLEHSTSQLSSTFIDEEDQPLSTYNMLLKTARMIEDVTTLNTEQQINIHAQQESLEKYASTHTELQHKI